MRGEEGEREERERGEREKERVCGWLFVA